MFKNLLKFFKQELFFIPLMAVIIEGCRHLILHFYPETALFDRGSELETFIFRLWQISWITCGSWLLMWVVFPSGFKALRRFYKDYSYMREEDQQKWATRLFLVFFFGMVLLLTGSAQTTRKALTDTLNAQLHVREATGRNDGADVEKYLRFVGLPKGNAWCAAFASYNLHAVGIQKPINPMSAWAPAFSNVKYVNWSQSLVKQHKARKPNPGDCFTLFYAHLKRVGHVGFIVGESGNYFITIEGNTGLAGSREGSGVHKLKRAKAKVYNTSDYITAYENTKAKSIAATGSTGVPDPWRDEVQGKGSYKPEGYATHRQYVYKDRQRVVHRLTSESGGRTHEYSGDSTSRYKLHSSDGHGLYRHTEITHYGLHQRRETFRRMLVQGSRIKGKGAESFGKGVPRGGQDAAERKRFQKDGRGPVYT